MRGLAILVLCAACGGGAAQTRPPVTIAQPAATTPPPAVTGSLQQPTGHATPTGPRPTSVPGTSIRFEGGDGSSIAQAIVIRGAKGESDGVAAEYKYLEMLYGPKGDGHNVQGQALLENGGRSFDKLDVDLKDGRTIAVFFDISDYFGKF
jgi:hypothetical protein